MTTRPEKINSRPKGTTTAAAAIDMASTTRETDKSCLVKRGKEREREIAGEGQRDRFTESELVRNVRVERKGDGF